MAYEHSEGGAPLDEDRHRRRVRDRQNDVRRRGLGNHAAATEAMITNASAGMDGLEATPL